MPCADPRADRFRQTPSLAQTLTPDLFRPARDGFVSPQDSPLRRTAESADRTGDAANDARLRDKDAPAKSRIGAIPTYGLPAASGASSSGYNSLNRTRKKAKYYPGQAKPKPPPGPGSKPPLPLPANGRVRLSIPPSETANKTPIAPAMAGTVAGQPPRKRLRIDDDPFGAIGDYAGSFLIKSALELRGGFDTNPRRTVVPKGSSFYVVAPEFLAVSEWQRHAVVADLRGSFTGYGNTFPPPTDGTISSAPVVIDRPDFTGHVDGRLDVSRDFRLHRAGPPARRHRQSRQPEHPGRPASAIRSIRRSAARSASTRISTACSCPPAPPSTAPSIRPQNSPTAPRPATTTATTTSSAASGVSATT